MIAEVCNNKEGRNLKLSSSWRKTKSFCNDCMADVKEEWLSKVVKRHKARAYRSNEESSA